MSWFKNLKIRVKMLISFFVIIALMLALSLVAIFEMRSVDEQNMYAGSFPGERATAILQFQSTSRDLRRVLATMTMYTPLGDSARIDPLVRDADAAFSSMMSALDTYDERTRNDPHFAQSYKDSRLATSKELRDGMTKYKVEVVDVVAVYAKNGQYSEALESNEFGAALVGSMRNATVELLESAQREASEADERATATANTATWVIIIIALAATLIAIVIALYMAALISKPLGILSTFMKKAGSTGDITLSPEDIATIGNLAAIKDEIGQAVEGSAAFVGHVTHIAQELETIASGDLTADVKLLSDADAMGKSLKQMIESLNNMFSEIQASTNHVSAGSKQIAEGAQSLAQGSTEQAASIEELSASIAEIADRTRANAATAERTAKLSETIKENAEKGSRQMDEMIMAVSDINEASKSISKIIKTIDDIAFQTNILALNAAVEAARAGQHGKGFAVVAEEVRNLASKSAEAAKDTGNMIQNSMDKAELGSRIAGETATSLSDIVNGINESSQLIAEIASASDEQSLGIAQINTGIDQVAQVVQQNSATAEEEAAASEEMSGQSAMLQQLLAQFKLKEGSGSYGSLPSGRSAKNHHAIPEWAGHAQANRSNDFGKY